MIRNLAPGPLDSCQICSSHDLQPVVHLGFSAPCDSPLTQERLRHGETSYPLHYARCRECGLVQIDYVVDGKELFHPEYPYRSGITETLRNFLHGLALRMCEKTGLKKNSLVVDIGSNDGTILQGFAKAGMRVLGVEATNIARIAQKQGIETLQEFFSPDTARKILASHGPAQLITAANVFAHVANFQDLMQGIHQLLEPDGFFVSESHYQLDILETLQYDSIYHEHLRFYLIKPLQRLFHDNGFTLVDVERIPNYGGSIRVTARKGRHHVLQPSVGRLLEQEEKAGCYQDATYVEFARRVRASRAEIRRTLVEKTAQAGPVPGIGCPGRCVTLLAYCGVGDDLMPYIAEQSTSLKLGMFTPTSHIPIVDEERLFREQPAYAMILSWHYAEAIVKGLRKKGLKSKVLVPLPVIREI
jgi:SAM-dependent methyltransferase